MIRLKNGRLGYGQADRARRAAEGARATEARREELRAAGIEWDRTIGKVGVHAALAAWDRAVNPWRAS